MARPCTVCVGKRRAEVDRMLANSTPVAQIARLVAISKDTIHRHAKQCSAKAVAIADRAMALQDLAAGIGLAVETVDLQRRTLDILTKAEKTKKLTTALTAIREARGNLELIGKFTGKLKPDAPAMTLNVFLGSPDWQRLESILLDALKPYPPALEAAGQALATIAEEDDAR